MYNALRYIFGASGSESTLNSVYNSKKPMGNMNVSCNSPMQQMQEKVSRVTVGLMAKEGVWFADTVAAFNTLLSSQCREDIELNVKFNVIVDYELHWTQGDVSAYYRNNNISLQSGVSSSDIPSYPKKKNFYLEKIIVQDLLLDGANSSKLFNFCQQQTANFKRHDITVSLGNAAGSWDLSRVNLAVMTYFDGALTSQHFANKLALFEFTASKIQSNFSNNIAMNFFTESRTEINSNFLNDSAPLSQEKEGLVSTEQRSVPMEALLKKVQNFKAAFSGFTPSSCGGWQLESCDLAVEGINSSMSSLYATSVGDGIMTISNSLNPFAADFFGGSISFDYSAALQDHLRNFIATHKIDVHPQPGWIGFVKNQPAGYVMRIFSKLPATILPEALQKAFTELASSQSILIKKI